MHVPVACRRNRAQCVERDADPAVLPKLWSEYFDCRAGCNIAGRSSGDGRERGEPMGRAPQRSLEAEMGHVSQYDMSFPCGVLASKEYDTA